uniref:Uncharacterized protein n=1 Tax=Glossina austeni TaxID=7395 RepID=A0A1A9VY87_GLOAU
MTVNLNHSCVALCCCNSHSCSILITHPPSNCNFSQFLLLLLLLLLLYKVSFCYALSNDFVFKSMYRDLQHTLFAIRYTLMFYTDVPMYVCLYLHVFLPDAVVTTTKTTTAATTTTTT